MPLEIHCFSTTSAWTDDEEIQADIIEHLLAILPEFHLRRYQAPGGRCLTETQLEPATAAPEVPRLHTRISPAALRREGRARPGLRNSPARCYA